jgi:hypothetical protein
VDGSTITVVRVTVTEVITIDGSAATVFPGFTGSMPGIVGITSLGLGPPVSNPG